MGRLRLAAVLMVCFWPSAARAQAPAMPPDEAGFVKIMNEARSAKKLSDEQLQAALNARMNKTCALLRTPSAAIVNWQGVVSYAGKNDDGDSVLRVAIADDVVLMTWISINGEPPNIPAADPLAKTVGALRSGDKIRFTGSFMRDNDDDKSVCIYLTGMGDEQLAAPIFGFRFRSVEKVEYGPAITLKPYDPARGPSGTMITDAEALASLRAESMPSAQEQKTELCSENIDCAWEKYSIPAEVRCKGEVERLAKYDFKWTEGWLGRKFARARWKDAHAGIMTISGDELKLQNGFGAWAIYMYECDYNIKTKMVLGVRAHAGRLP